MLNLTTSEIIDHLHDDLVSHGFLAQCIGLHGVRDKDYLGRLRQVLLELMASDRIEIGVAVESGNYVEMIGWAGTVEAKVDRALSAVVETDQADNEFAFWLCLKENVDRYEDQRDTDRPPARIGTLADISPARFARQTMGEILNELGGERHRDGDDEFWLFDRQPLQVSFANPRAIELPNTLDIAVGVRVSEPCFSSLVSRITQHAKPFSSLLVWEAEFELESIQKLVGSFKETIESEFERASKIDLQSIIHEFASSLPDRPLTRQIDHLAALAWKADFLTLEGYLDTFRRGKRLNFITFIDQGMIERALDAAYDRVT